MHAKPAHNWTIEELAKRRRRCRARCWRSVSPTSSACRPCTISPNGGCRSPPGCSAVARQYRQHRRRDRLRLRGRLQPRFQEDGRRAALGVAPARSSTPCSERPETGFIPSMTDHEHHHHDHESSELSETDLRVRALQTILIDKGYTDAAALDAIVETYEQKIGPHIGARVVARAWTDPAFRQALLTDATAACAVRSGRQGRRPSGGGREHARAAQHGRLHPVLLLPVGRPRPAARLVQVVRLSLAHGEGATRGAARVRRDPARATEIRVWDRPPRSATWSCRCGPAGTEGWSEEKLAALVTRDSMVGTGLPLSPGARP